MRIYTECNIRDGYSEVELLEEYSDCYLCFTTKFDYHTQEIVMERAIDALVRKMMKEFDTKQIAAEVKNEAIRRASIRLTDIAWDKLNANETIERATASVEKQIQGRVKAMLNRGIVVRFDTDETQS